MSAANSPLFAIQDQIPEAYVSASMDFLSMARSLAADGKGAELAIAYVLGLWLLSRNARDRMLDLDGLTSIRNQASSAIVQLRQLKLQNDAFDLRDRLQDAEELPASAEAHLPS